MLATSGGTPEQLRLAGVQLEVVRLHPAVNIIYTHLQKSLSLKSFTAECLVEP